VSLVVMEATGGYEAALACALQAAGLAVAVVNPKTGARLRQVDGAPKFANPEAQAQFA
jgi:transposase